MKRKTFVTLFPGIQNIHLVKDVGMIPYCMKKYYGSDSKIVVYKNQNYPYFETDVKSLGKMYFPLKRQSILNSTLFLAKNAKKNRHSSALSSD